MQHNTPELRACQGANSDNISIPQAVANQYNRPPLSTSDINSIIEDVGGKPIKTSISKVIEDCNQSTETPAKQKSIAESKRLIEHFKEKLETYPKYLSYEGSVVLCVILSIGDTTEVKIGGLPKVDQDLIMGQLPSNATIRLSSHDAFLSVEFTDSKDFILTYSPVLQNDSQKYSDVTTVKLNFFNTVIHPEKLADTNVPVEQVGGKVTVGGSLVLDSQRIKQLVGNIPKDKTKTEDDEPPRRQPVYGRNAFEIRYDLLQLSMELSVHNCSGGPIPPEEVIMTAKKLYTFVEDRNRR